MIFSWLYGAKLERRIDEMQRTISEGFKMVQAAFEKLREQIEKSTTLQRSAITLITGLADQLHELAKHPSADEINALADDLAAHAKELADVIAAHAEDED